MKIKKFGAIQSRTLEDFGNFREITGLASSGSLGASRMPGSVWRALGMITTQYQRTQAVFGAL